MEPLDPTLLTGVHDRATLAAAGVSDAELRGALWVGVHHGLHRWATADGTDPDERVAAAAALLPPGGAVGGWAAARAWGAADLDGLDRWGRAELDVLLCLPRADQRLRRPGVRPFRSDLDDEDVVMVEGLAVTSAVRTGFDLARLAGSLEDAVVALDALLRAGRVSRLELIDYLERRRRWRGVPLARRAVALADRRAESTGESRLRVLWIVDAGLPYPEVNPDVRDAGGRFVARSDVLDDEAALSGEYDGAPHATAGRRAEDSVRREGVEDLGLRQVVLTAVDLVGTARREAAGRLRRLHARGLECRAAGGASRWQLRPRPRD